PLSFEHAAVRFRERSMYRRVALHHLPRAAALAYLIFGAPPASAQAPPPPDASAQHQHEHAATPEQEHGAEEMPMAREGSGTAWLPDLTPMYAIHWQRGPWQLMAHENALIHIHHASGDSGD